jgi:hypothetical protein
MPTPGLEIGENLGREIDTIRRLGLTSRVVAIGPSELDRVTRQATYVIYERLGWPVPKAVHLAAYTGQSDVLTLHPSIGPDDPDRGGRYERAITAALRTIARPTST